MNIRNSMCAAVNMIMLLLMPALLRAQLYMPAEKGCKAEFRAKSHRGDGQVISGTLSNIKGKIVFDPKNLASASFDIMAVIGNTITGVAEIDRELKKDIYFNTAKYPAIKFKSTSLTQDKPGGVVYLMQGNLTIKGITKPAHIQFTAAQMGAGYIFRGSLEFSKIAFAIGSKADGIDDNVSVFIEVRANKK